MNDNPLSYDEQRAIIDQNLLGLKRIAKEHNGAPPIFPPVYPEAYRMNEDETGIFYRMTTNEFLKYASEKRACSVSSLIDPHSSGGKACSSWEEAMRYARYGWPEKTKLASELAARVDDRLRSCAPKIEWNYEVFGGQPDVGRFLSGEPENMLHRQEADAKFSPSNRIVKIVLDANANAFGHTEELAAARGAVAMAAVDAVERTGRRAEVWISSGFRAGASVIFDVQIKAANQPLDLDMMAFFTSCKDVEYRFLWQCAVNIGFRSFRGIEAHDQGDLYVEYLPGLAHDPIVCMEATLELLKKGGMEFDS